jgi:hypothetical protein
VLEYVMRNRMYAFAEEEEKEEGGGEGEGVVKVNRIAR